MPQRPGYPSFKEALLEDKPFNPPVPADKTYVRMVKREVEMARARCCEMLSLPYTQAHHQTKPCRGCGCDVDQSTLGCKTCYNRDYQRSYKGRDKGKGKRAIKHRKGTRAYAEAHAINR